MKSALTKKDFFELLVLIIPGVLAGVMINKTLVSQISESFNFDVFLIALIISIPLFIISSLLKKA